MFELTLFAALGFGHTMASNLVTPSDNELKMLDEINFVRTQPADYETYIVSYTALYLPEAEERLAADELRNLLKTMIPLDSLKWSPMLWRGNQAIYRTQKKNNSDVRENSRIEMITCADIELARLALIHLLVDSADPNRINRNLFFKNSFTDFACYSYEKDEPECRFFYSLEFN